MLLKNRFLILVSFIIVVFALLTYQGINRGGYPFAIFQYPIHLMSIGESAGIKRINAIFGIGNRDEMTGVLNQQRSRCTELEMENQRLRALLDLKSQRPDFVTTAEVFARDPGNWFHLLWIDKGSMDGVRKGMVAVTPNGVVGMVRDVLGNRASIMLITDINSAVAVRIQDIREEGILEGRGDNMTYLKYIPRDVEVGYGQAVITSGLDGIYPEGIIIGYVKGVRKTGSGFFQEIVVQPIQDLNRVEEVAIVRR
ncbi:MAG: rod shape-determining protein MreC [Thermodesulfovibrionia bacterium]